MKKFKELVKKLRKQTVKGFTLIEMVIVIAIIAILMILVVPNLTNQKNNAETKTDEAFQTTLQAQVTLAEEDGKKITSWDQLEQAKYMSEKQAKRAQEKFVISNGEVVKK